MTRRRATGRSCRRQPGGFTLLEVILAIGVLTLGLAMIMTVNKNAYRNIHAASDGLHAEMVAESVLAELRCRRRAIESIGPFQLDQQQALGDWVVQVIVEPTIVQELLQVRILVGRTLDPGTRPDCEVVRWFPNPDFQQVAPVPGASSTTSTSSSSSSP